MTSVNDDADRERRGFPKRVRQPALVKIRQRRLIERAAGEGLSATEAKVLLAVLYFTSCRSVVSDRVTRRQLAERSGLSERRANEGLRRLAKRGLIGYEPGVGGRPAEWGKQQPRAPLISLLETEDETVPGFDGKEEESRDGSSGNSGQSAPETQDDGGPHPEKIFPEVFPVPRTTYSARADRARVPGRSKSSSNKDPFGSRRTRQSYTDEEYRRRDG